MEKLVIEGTVSSPSISFNAESGILEMVGESYPENSFEFFAPVIAWLKQYVAGVDKTVSLKVNLSYLNTSSTKCMIDMLDTLEDAFKDGKSISVEWYYDEDNRRALDTIEEFREDFTMPFAAVPRKVQQ